MREKVPGNSRYRAGVRPSSAQHSRLCFAAIHTKQGIILYANDFKIDRSPTLGEPPDFARLKALGKEGVVGADNRDD